MNVQRLSLLVLTIVQMSRICCNASDDHISPNRQLRYRTPRASRFVRFPTHHSRSYPKLRSNAQIKSNQYSNRHLTFQTDPAIQPDFDNYQVQSASYSNVIDHRERPERLTYVKPPVNKVSMNSLSDSNRFHNSLPSSNHVDATASQTDLNEQIDYAEHSQLPQAKSIVHVKSIPNYQVISLK
jgi:hypothetical protein